MIIEYSCKNSMYFLLTNQLKTMLLVKFMITYICICFNETVLTKFTEKILQTLIQNKRTISLLREISKPMTLLKKLARRGFKGPSASRKEYTLVSRLSSPASLSLMAPTSEVKSSHAVFGYLKSKYIKSF